MTTSIHKEMSIKVPNYDVKIKYPIQLVPLSNAKDKIRAIRNSTNLGQ